MDLRTAISLLKTPTAQLAVNGGSQHPDKRKEGGHGPTLADEIEHLLPTPTAKSYGYNQSVSPGAAIRPSLNTLGSADPDRWGDYAQAIARQEEAFGIPAPDPTGPHGRGGAQKLSGKFTEWMMALDPGWITDVPGITNNDAIRMCGNGVVWRQAEAALRVLVIRSGVLAVAA
jgi:hypothetical protein